MRPTGGGVRVAVRLQPKASADRIDGLAAGADGGVRLKVRVTAAAEQGKANAALLKLLAKAWRVPAGDLAVVAGAKDRNKTVLVSGDAAALAPRLQAWLRTL